MAKFELADQATINLDSPAWKTFEAWAEWTIERLRKQREIPGVDVRKLDVDLGSIQAMKALLGLPAEIKREHQRKDDPVTSDGFGIPTPKY